MRYGVQNTGDDLDYLRTYIRHLRQKIEDDPAHPKLIVRSPGVGYMLTCPEQDAAGEPGRRYAYPGIVSQGVN